MHFTEFRNETGYAAYARRIVSTRQYQYFIKYVIRGQIELLSMLPIS